MPYPVQRVCAALGLIVLSPVVLVVALVLIVTQGRPVIYAGERYGRNGEPFMQYKFRTMVNNADALLSDGEVTTARVTPVGRILRRSSLDEIPQLANVVKGDMALVGPRPLIDLVFDKVPAGHRRFDVLPGITGRAQVSGRNELPWSKRLELDAEYVEVRSPLVDLRLLLKTLDVTIRGKGIAADRNTEQVFDL